MLFKKKLLASLIFVFSLSSFAHFQMIHTPTLDVSGKSFAPLELIFTHPANGINAENMDIGKVLGGEIKSVVEFSSNPT